MNRTESWSGGVQGNGRARLLLHYATTPSVHYPNPTKKAPCASQGAFLEKRFLLSAKDGVLGGFCDAELHDAFGGDLNLLARRRIAPDARGAIDQNQFTQSRQRESILGVLVGQLRDAFENVNGLSFGERVLFSDCSG